MNEQSEQRVGISLDEWYPLVKDLVPTPRTLWRKGLDLMPLAYGAEGDPDGSLLTDFKAVCAWLREAGEQLGWPLFLRTGLTSGKHDWRHTCDLRSAAEIERHVSALCEYSAMAGFMGLPADVWVAREMLATQSPFSAFEGMPITRERRYFVRDGELLGHHPYWPPQAFEDSYNEIITSEPGRDWRELLDRLNAESPTEVAELSALSVRVGHAVGGAWSVDWLWLPEMPKTGQPGWMLTDMAHAEESFVWREYPTAPNPDAFNSVSDD